MNFAANVVAHPDRITNAETLAEHIGTPIIILDDEQLGATANHIRAWQYHALIGGPPWRLVIEDDAQPVEEFINQASEALAAAPADIVSLYLGKQRPPQHQQAIANAVNKAAANHACWILSDRLYHAVAVAIKTEHIPDILQHLHAKPHLPIDEGITTWARRHNQPIAYSQPSLVDHNDTIPSIAKHRDGARRRPGRTAWTTGTQTHWNNTLVTT